MRVWLRGFDDYELRLRPAPGEPVGGEQVTLPPRQLDAVLRNLPAEVAPVRLRALMQQTGHRGELHDDAALLDALRQRIDRGELVFVQRSRQTVDARIIERSVPQVPKPFEPDEIIDSDDWIELLIADEDDAPVVGVAYELELPDGSVRRGRTNRDGIARVEQIPSGNCKLTLVELDESAWGPA
jgi:hypothetical protein